MRALSHMLVWAGIGKRGLVVYRHYRLHTTFIVSKSQVFRTLEVDSVSLDYRAFFRGVREYKILVVLIATVLTVNVGKHFWSVLMASFLTYGPHASIVCQRREDSC